MSLFQDGIDKTLELLRGAPTVAAQKAHLDWLKDQLTEVEKKLKALEDENTQLLRENRALRTELDGLKKADQYLDLVSCAVKMGPDGKYADIPLCPSCKKPYSTMGAKYVCGTCGIRQPMGPVRGAIAEALKAPS